MNENDCLDTQFRLLQGMFFDEKFENDRYMLCTSSVMDDHFWNVASIKKGLNSKTLREIEDKLKSLKRIPCIYIGIDNEYYYSNKKMLLDNGYRLCNSDVYMVLEKKKPLDIELEIKEVETEAEYNDFMDVLTSAFNGSEENPDENVYAGDITDCYFGAIKDTIGDKKHMHMIAYDGGFPVAVATLSLVDGIGGVNRVGTRQGYWNRGYGKQMMTYVINKFGELGGKALIISTEYHSKNQKFYEKLGFKEIYVMEQYIKGQ